MRQFDPSKRDRSRFGEIVGRLFPPRVVTVRCDARVSFFRISSERQLVGLSIFAFLMLWAGLSTFAVFLEGRSLRDIERRLAATEASYQVFVEQMSRNKDELNTIASGLEQNHQYIVGLGVGEASVEEHLARIEAQFESGGVAIRGGAAVRDKIAARVQRLVERIKSASLAQGDGESSERAEREVSHSLIASEGERALRERAQLGEQLASTVQRFDLQVAALAGHQRTTLGGQAGADADAVGLRLQRDLVSSERNHLSEQVGVLRGRVATMENANVALVEKFSRLAGGGVCEIERTLGGMGIDVARLTSRSAAPAGQGGPYIPAETANLSNRKLRATLAALNVNVGRVDRLQEVARRLPVGSPVDHYQFSSFFGTREDPINGNPARHDGLDLAAPLGTPVRSTSPGVVVFVGWRDRYGRTVVIDHGQGFSTLYGHLHKALVTKGQKVETGMKIGLLGSTGRSTGPHLHYEVHVNGKPQDPYPFVRVNRNVFKG
ncbi:MAG: peptidoglycan DD-metalloendopeptidase family protein [Alphaproteobacteria bacterium]